MARSLIIALVLAAATFLLLIVLEVITLDQLTNELPKILTATAIIFLAWAAVIYLSPVSNKK
jgi:hypothetical protein